MMFAEAEKAWEERWYWCLITDDDERPREPDWSKVPEAKREVVRVRWFSKAAPPIRRFKLWGPRIPMYSRMPGLTVQVEGPAEESVDMPLTTQEVPE